MTVTIENLYTGNGSTTDYSFTFPYLDTTDIKASLGGNATTAYTLLNATTVRFNSTPTNGVAIRIYRETAFNTPKATFYPGSAIRANDLNDNTLQNLYVNQESNDKVALALTLFLKVAPCGKTTILALVLKYFGKLIVLSSLSLKVVESKSGNDNV